MRVSLFLLGRLGLGVRLVSLMRVSLLSLRERLRLDVRLFSVTCSLVSKQEWWGNNSKVTCVRCLDLKPQAHGTGENAHSYTS